MLGIDCSVKYIKEGFFCFLRVAYSRYKKIFKNEPKFVWLRKIDNVTAWSLSDQDCFTEISYKILPDLKPKALQPPLDAKSTLSFYCVPNDEILIRRIIATIISNKTSLKDCAYSVIGEFEFKLLNFQVINNDGDTKDLGINHFHKDVVVLSVEQINKLSKMIAGNRIEELSEMELKKVLRKSLDCNYLQPSDINGNVLSRVLAS